MVVVQSYCSTLLQEIGIDMVTEVSILEYAEDISNAEAPPPIPVGEYPFTVESVTQKISATSGNEYLGVVLRIDPNDYPADFDADSFPDGVTLGYNRLIVEDNARARYNMRKWCEAIGAKMGKKIDPTDWIGMTGKVSVTHQDYEGEPRAQASRVTSN